MGKVILFRKKGGFNMAELKASDVAKAFLSISKMSPKKLQKLCYYAQGWYLALFGESLFDEDFQAWIHGPVIPELYDEYKEYGWRDIPQIDFCTVPEDVVSFVKEVYDSYGYLTGDQLERLSHSEAPWKNARKGKKPWEASTEIITKDSMKEYFRYVYETAKN